MPYSKNLILVIEDDSRISRLVRNHFEQAFPQIRVEIAGSPSKARMICEKFNPQLIIWDGQPNERGTREDYANSVTDSLWKRVIPISSDSECQTFAQGKGAHTCIPKPSESLNAWADQLTAVAKQVMTPAKPARK